MKTELIFDFDNLVLRQLESLISNPLDQWIKFPDVFQRLGTVYHLDKETSWKLLFSMKNKGLLEVNRIKGVRLAKERELNAS